MREAFGEFHHARALAHGGSNAHQAIVALRHVAQPASEHILVFGSSGFGRCNRGLWSRRCGRPRFGLDLVDGVVAHRVPLGGQEALALHGANVQELRPLQVFHVLQCVDQPRQVVAIQRADIVKAQLFKQRAGRDHALHVFFGAFGQFPGRADLFQHPFGALAHGDIELAGPDFGEVGGEPALVVADGHLVVIQDDQHIGPLVAGVGECLNRHAPGDGAIANDRDHLAVDAQVPGRQCHTHGGGDAGGGVADAERVVLALGALGKSRQSAGLAHAVHLSHAAGKNFVGIGLVTHIPDNAVVRRVVDIVQGDGKLDHAQASAKMSAGLAHAV